MVNVRERDNETWLRELDTQGPVLEAAVQDLRHILTHGLRSSLSGRAGVDDAFLEDTAQEALLKVIDRRESFAGRSRFTSWAMAIAVRVALTELRKRHWKNVSLERFAPNEDQTADVVDMAPGPAQQSVRSELLAAMSRVIREQLTERQQMVLNAELNGVPQEEIARQLGSNRNAIYKLMHDARRKLKAGLQTAGFDTETLHTAYGD